MSRPLIAILSDFGTADHYVASMKGTILGICPDAALVDITHEVPAHDVRAGSWLLRACVCDFPPGTVFLAVVDPGVGTARRGLAVEAEGRFLVGPDNGLLTLAAGALGQSVAVSLETSGLARPVVSRTFEGRDRFAPAAAWLAAGTPLADFGPIVRDTVGPLVGDPVCEAGRIRGEIVFVDRFGNLITNVPQWTVVDEARGRIAAVFLDGRHVGPLSGTYEDVRQGEPCALFGSTGHLEIALREASAAVRFGCCAGGAVDVVWG